MTKECGRTSCTKYFFTTVVVMVHNCEATGFRPFVPGAAFRDAGPCKGGQS